MTTTPDTANKIDEALARDLQEIVRRIERNAEQRAELYRERLAIWALAARHGWTQARIAEASDTTEGAVAQAFHKARRGR